MRKSGFYWVDWPGGDGWQPAQWDADEQCWYAINWEFALHDSDLAEIGSEIVRPA